MNVVRSGISPPSHIPQPQVYTHITQYPHPTSHFTSFLYALDIQILMVIYLGSNNIGEKGAQYHGDALRNNAVIFIVFSSISYTSPSIFAETDHTQSGIESNWRQRNAASC